MMPIKLLPETRQSAHRRSYAVQRGYGRLAKPIPVTQVEPFQARIRDFGIADKRKFIDTVSPFKDKREQVRYVLFYLKALVFRPSSNDRLPLL